MIRATVVLGLMLAGCAAKTAPVQMSMKSMMAEDVTSVVLKSVELNHASDGWVTVAISNAETTENGTEVSIASTELPKGKYTGARAKYVRTSRQVTPTKTITRTEAPAAEAEGDEAEPAPTKTITRDEAAEDRPEPGTPVISKAEGLVSVDNEFCLSKDGNDVMLVIKEKDGNVMLKVNGPGC